MLGCMSVPAEVSSVADIMTELVSRKQMRPFYFSTQQLPPLFRLTFFTLGLTVLQRIRRSGVAVASISALHQTKSEALKFAACLPQY